MSNEKIKKLRDKLLKLGKNASIETKTIESDIIVISVQQKAIIYYEIANALAEVILDD